MSVEDRAELRARSGHTILDERPVWNRRVGVGSEHTPQGGSMYIGIGTVIIIIILLAIFVF